MQFATAHAGTWTEGEAKGRRALTIAYRASKLLTHPEGKPGDYIGGPPEHFQLDDGRDGHALLAELMPFPDLAAFEYGCVREALHAAHLFALWEEWAGPGNFEGRDYFVDNQQGESAIVSFHAGGCVGVVSSGDPHREYELQAHLAAAPAAVKEPLEQVARHFIERFGQYHRLTGILWSENGRLNSDEPFHMLYAYGFEIMEAELRSDETWLETAVEENELDEEAARAMISIARSFVTDSKPVRPTREQFDRLFPKDSPGRAEALAGISGPGDHLAIIGAPRPA